MHKTGGFLHIQQILRCDTKRARRDKECAPQQRAIKKEPQRLFFDSQEIAYRLPLHSLYAVIALKRLLIMV